MINNKGFAVSAVLYTLLIAFLMFLGAALAQFETSSGIVGKANDDLINGTKFEVMQVKSSDSCLNGFWYNSNTLVRIKSRYGTKYWPKDFTGASITQSDSSFSIEPGSANGKIEVETIEGNNLGLKFIDGATNEEKTITLYDICE